MLGMLDECIEMAGEMKQDVHWLAFNRSEGHGLGNRRCQINWLDIDLSLWHHVVSCKDIWHESINLVDFYEFACPTHGPQIDSNSLCGEIPQPLTPVWTTYMCLLMTISHGAPCAIHWYHDINGGLWDWCNDDSPGWVHIVEDLYMYTPHTYHDFSTNAMHITMVLGIVIHHL